MTYHYTLGDKLSRGDIFRRVGVVTNIVGGENEGPKYGDSNIIIISRNCEIDKPLVDSNSVSVARVRRLSSQGNKRIREYIRDNSILHAYYLPSDGQFMEESWVDWRTIQPVSKDMLKKLRTQQDYYKCTLDEEMLKACLEHFNEFFNKPDDVDNEQSEDTLMSITSQQTEKP